MFMRVNSKCAHQVRPPLTPSSGGLTLGWSAPAAQQNPTEASAEPRAM
jgi:hypothetical protein